MEYSVRCVACTKDVIIGIIFTVWCMYKGCDYCNTLYGVVHVLRMLLLEYSVRGDACTKDAIIGILCMVWCMYLGCDYWNTLYSVVQFVSKSVCLKKGTVWLLIIHYFSSLWEAITFIRVLLETPPPQAISSATLRVALESKIFYRIFFISDPNLSLSFCEKSFVVFKLDENLVGFRKKSGISDKMGERVSNKQKPLVYSDDNVSQTSVFIPCSYKKNLNKNNIKMKIL